MTRSCLLALTFIGSAALISLSDAVMRQAVAAPVPKELQPPPPYNPKAGANRDCVDCPDCTYMAYYEEETKPAIGGVVFTQYRFVLNVGATSVVVYNGVTTRGLLPPAPTGSVKNYVTDTNDCVLDNEIITLPENDTIVIQELAPGAARACVTPNQLPAIQVGDLRRWETVSNNQLAGLPPYPLTDRVRCLKSKNSYPNP